MRLLEWLRRSAARPKAEDALDTAETPELEHLRAEFRSRYHSFKMLLTANNKALENMAEIEGALAGDRPVGMSFLRSRCTRVSTNVFQMLKSLNELAPHKYERLYDRFVAIQNKVNPFLSVEITGEQGAWVVPLRSLSRQQADQVGYKMASLGEIGSRLGLDIPNGFVVTAHAYNQFMEHRQLAAEIDELIQSADPTNLEDWHALSASIRKRIEEAPLPDALAAVIARAYGQLESDEGRGVAVAVRSSALGEDAPGISFAGQYATEFNIGSAESVLQAYKRVVASKYSAQAILYRLHHGVREEEIAMCVGCMPIVNAVSGGVAYSRNPLNRHDAAVFIQSVWGLPKPVADGSVASDLFVMSREAPPRLIRREIASKAEAFRHDEGIYRMVPTEEESDLPSLSEEDAARLARVVLEIENHFGSPQDVEWALGMDGRFVILQARPLYQSEWSSTTETESKALASHQVLLSGGATASPGTASGPVFIARKEADILRFPPGSVLVVAQALPYWATVLDRASAVVTERGSIVGHLASVAREFQVPALFGVEHALARLQDQREVTVDAAEGNVYEGRVEIPGRPSRPSTCILSDSPVYVSLRGAAEHILPLHLLDPDAPDFRPEHCTTFHDMTRFCHEKAVREMFQFGTEHTFPERAARQLHVDVPMQFWVIDLEDGFEQGVPAGRFIHLDQIASIPMLALWRGMTTIRWEGPPPVDTRGFMSVLMESAANPSLDPSMRQSFTARNYFMISKHFCSLQSRFGYHFSTVEALVSERTSENYISFQFKGGAANIDRRTQRARLVADLLEEQGFRNEVDQDSVRARLEGYDRQYMETRLRAVGYLIIHTRQLDMVMTNVSTINAQKKRMSEDLKTIAGNGGGHSHAS